MRSSQKQQPQQPQRKFQRTYAPRSPPPCLPGIYPLSSTADRSADSPKRFFTVFAGRERYLSILCQYLDRLLDAGLIDEVHFWAYTSKESDIAWMKSRSEVRASRYRLFLPPNPDSKVWAHYYQFYAEFLRDDDVVIKCDDDVVFLDLNLTRAKTFLDSVTGDGLHFPNIVNNDVLALLQQQYGVHDLFDYGANKVAYAFATRGDRHPLTTWFTEHAKAHAIHTLFLRDPTRFCSLREEVVPYWNRVSINFFATRGAFAKRAFAHLTPRSFDDETFFGHMPLDFKTPHQIHMGWTVVHFQFGPQEGTRLDDQLLSQFAALAENQTALAKPTSVRNKHPNKILRTHLGK